MCRSCLIKCSDKNTFTGDGKVWPSGIIFISCVGSLGLIPVIVGCYQSLWVVTSHCGLLPVIWVVTSHYGLFSCKHTPNVDITFEKVMSLF